MVLEFLAKVTTQNVSTTVFIRVMRARIGFAADTYVVRRPAFRPWNLFGIFGLRSQTRKLPPKFLRKLASVTSIWNRAKASENGGGIWEIWLNTTTWCIARTIKRELKSIARNDVPKGKYNYKQVWVCVAHLFCRNKLFAIKNTRANDTDKRPSFHIPFKRQLSQEQLTTVVPIIQLMFVRKIKIKAFSFFPKSRIASTSNLPIAFLTESRKTIKSFDQDSNLHN